LTGSIRIEFAPDVADDVDRILSHLPEHEINDAAARVQNIVAAVDVLERNPLIGRPMEINLRELVIGRSARGYVVLYRYI
jgi:toxin ParE1/3/4